MSYAFYLGCTIPSRLLSYEISARKVCEVLDIDLVDLQDFICCGTPIENVSEKVSIAMAAYNLSLAEEENLDILALCNGCVNSLKRANYNLKRSEKLKEEINKVLSKVGKEYRGKIRVKHFIQVLYEDFGIEELKRKIKNKLNLKVATHTGCHLVKPSYVMKFDDPENPKVLDELVRATGADSIDYMYKNTCCAQPLRGLNDELSLKILREKLACREETEAECIITVCPACNIQLELGQLELKTKLKEEFSLPVLHYPELLGLALGIEKEELGLKYHKIKPNKLFGDL